MCYEIYHTCRFCKRHYHCDIDDNICPTINFDADGSICDECKKELEIFLRANDVVTNDQRDK